MLEPTEELTLSMTQNFEIERMSRVIDAETDIEALKRVTKQLLMAWECQKAATRWTMSHKLPAPFRVTPEETETSS
jgi:hypothetical protein